jgi:hypothetical protein
MDRRRARFCPQIEALETRLVMNNRFVVPVAQADNVATFGSLSAALTTPGLQAGDTIQVEPGSTPGSISALPAVQNLTIQGDPAFRPDNIPTFTVASTITVDAARAGLTLRGANVKLSGDLDYHTDARILDCKISGDAHRLILTETTGSVLVNSTLSYDAGGGNSNFVVVKPTTGSHNLIQGNSFVLNTPTQGFLVAYVAGSTPECVASDRIADNSFTATAATANGQLLNIGPSAIDGLMIDGNTFTSSVKSLAVGFFIGNHHVTFRDNNVDYSGLSDFAVCIGDTQTASSTLEVDFLNNRIKASDNKVGLEIEVGGLNSKVSARVEGNDFSRLTTAVDLFGYSGGATSGTVDLGGGVLGSKGGNNFRGCGTAFTLHSNVYASNIPADFNLFSVADPESVVTDKGDGVGKADVITDLPLTGNAAYVQTLYHDFLRRTGNILDQADAGGWITQLFNGASAAAVANAIARSPEALGIQVDGLYHRYLGRDADAGGRAYFVSYLQTNSLEAATAAILGSAEYQARFANNFDYVESLYSSLLHRTGGVVEANGWAAAVPQLGRNAIAAAFLGSNEYRVDVVTDDYFTLLHRQTPPSQGEVAGWVNSGLDLNSIAIAFAGSVEFGTNG